MVRLRLVVVGRRAVSGPIGIGRRQTRARIARAAARTAARPIARVVARLVVVLVGRRRSVSRAVTGRRAARRVVDFGVVKRFVGPVYVILRSVRTAAITRTAARQHDNRVALRCLAATGRRVRVVVSRVRSPVAVVVVRLIALQELPAHGAFQSHELSPRRALAPDVLVPEKHKPRAQTEGDEPGERPTFAHTVNKPERCKREEQHRAA